MRQIALFLLAFNINAAFCQKIEFKVQFSEPLAVLEFISNITSHSPSNAYKDVFDSSKYNNEKYRSLLSKFESINYVYWYEYTQYPFGNKIGGSTYFLINKNLIESKTIEDFESKSIGIIPNADLAELSKILLEFLPVYREIILKPNKVLLEKQIELLRKKIKETDIPFLIGKIKLFHNSSWSTSKPFILNICPTKGSNNIHATAFFNYAFINLPSNNTDMDLILTLMFHEAFHIIYDEQSLSFKNEFANWFKENPSKHSKYAELLFNEAITTALANGYLYNCLKKSLMDPKKWYDNKYIGSMAYEIYPLTLKYLNENKQIDKSFINEYIKIYETKFPEWTSEIGNLLANRFVICEDKNAQRYIDANFLRPSIAERVYELNSQSLQKIKTLPITKLIMITKNNQKSIELVKQTFTELSDWNPDFKSDFSNTIFLPDKTYLIIVNSITKPVEGILAEIKFN